MARHRAPDSQLYLSSAALDELDQAQAELDAHLPSGSDGRCLRCHQEIPCAARERASRTFARYGCLPLFCIAKGCECQTQVASDVARFRNTFRVAAGSRRVDRVIDDNGGRRAALRAGTARGVGSVVGAVRG
jgi:hypothetical protein